MVRWRRRKVRIELCIRRAVLKEGSTAIHILCLYACGQSREWDLIPDIDARQPHKIKLSSQSLTISLPEINTSDKPAVDSKLFGSLLYRRVKGLNHTVTFL